MFPGDWNKTGINYEKTSQIPIPTIQKSLLMHFYSSLQQRCSSSCLVFQCRCLKNLNSRYTYFGKDMKSLVYTKLETKWVKTKNKHLLTHSKNKSTWKNSFSCPQYLLVFKERNLLELFPQKTRFNFFTLYFKEMYLDLKMIICIGKQAYGELNFIPRLYKTYILSFAHM